MHQSNATNLEASGLLRAQIRIESQIQGFISQGVDDMRCCILDLESSGQLSASSR